MINSKKYRFRTVVRILGLVFLFIHKCGKKHVFDFLKVRNFSNALAVRDTGNYLVFPTKVTLNVPKIAVVHLSKLILDAAKNYFFHKAALEVEHFVNPSKYENKSIWKNGILYYTGQILPSQTIQGR